MDKPAGIANMDLFDIGYLPDGRMQTGFILDGKIQLILTLIEATGKRQLARCAPSWCTAT
ncbi:MAG: hypothetical protein WCC17_17040 [Candidatus Nitrosopolaris sp.]